MTTECIDCDRVCQRCGYEISGGWEHAEQVQSPESNVVVCKLVRASRPVGERIGGYLDHEHKHVLRYTEEQLRARLAEQASDIAMVLTVYDEHVAPENRGPWRERLGALVEGA